MKISDIADIINVTEKDPSNSGIDVFVGLEHYDIAEPVIKRFGSTKMLSTAAKKFEAGDVLIARRNVYLQRASVAHFAGLTSGDSIVLRVKKNLKIEGTDYETMCQLLPFILNSINFWDYANTNADGTMSKRLSPAILQEYEFGLPSIDEQKVLAEKLWAAYEVKQSYLKMIEATQEMIKSHFIEMFSNKALKEVYLEDVVSEECSLSYGIVQPGDGVDDGIPVVRPVDLIGSVVEPDNLKRTTIDIANSYKRTALKGGELLLCVRGTTGILSMASNRLNGGNVTRGIVPIWFKKDISKTFMFHQMKSDYVQKQIKEKTYGTTLLQINIKDLRKIKVILPPEDLQLKFVSIAEQADKSISELRKSIDAIDKVIKSLINENL